VNFFASRAFNRLYQKVALQAVAGHGGEAFALVYLLKAGFSYPLPLANGLDGTALGYLVVAGTFGLPSGARPEVGAQPG
jgi:hypothetical protein